MRIHSKELLMGSGGDKKFILTVFYSGTSLLIAFPQRVGSVIYATWVTHNYNNNITGYFYPRLLSISGALGTAGSKITADGSWYETVTATFKDEVVVGGFRYLRYSYNYTSMGGNFVGYVFLSPSQKVGDIIFSASFGGAGIGEIISLSDSSISYKGILPSFNVEVTLTYNSTGQKIEYIYRA